MKQAQKDYQKLHEISRHTSILEGAARILEWDHETYMPQGAAEIRGEQLKAMAGIIHKEKIGKKFTNALGKLIDLKKGTIASKDLSDEQKAALREWRRDYIKSSALPKRFVEEQAKLTSHSMLAWRQAKATNNFKLFAPFLTKIVNMSRKKADLLGYSEHPYDALLDLYEPEATTKDIATLFGGLKKEIVSLLKKITKAKEIDDSFIHGEFPHDKQLEFSKRILKDLGYSNEHGRLDMSAHPFSTSTHPTDSRITTRIHPTSLISCISVILHEVGHAFYELGLPIEHFGSPLGEHISLGVHESQSRWWETRIGQGKAFWTHYLPLLKKEFNGPLQKVSLDAFYRAVNKVTPSFIRVEADEVTYPLHVILRFEIEKALIEGSLSIKEIPEAWNAKMQELLGIKPKEDSEGCLQDVHWAMAGFGYFPTYTLGNLYAAHLFETFAKQHKDWEKRVAQGDMLFIKEWLTTSIHQHGRRYSSKDLLKKVTGKPFSENAYVDYLKGKYSDIYSLKD